MMSETRRAPLQHFTDCFSAVYSNKVRRILPIGEMVKGCVLYKYMGNLRTS